MSRFETKRYFDTYVARDGRIYDQKETPEEGAGADDSGCGCIALIIIAIYLIL